MDERHRDEGGRRRGFLAGYLASSAGAWYLGLIRTAKDWGFKPTALIHHEDGAKPPGDWDYLLAFAEAIVASEQCQSCGRPKWICQSTDPDIEFRVYDETCNAVARKTLHDKRRKGDPAPGVTTGIDHYVFSRTDIAEFRQPWLKKQRADAEQREKTLPVRPREHPPGWSPPTLDSAP